MTAHSFDRVAAIYDATRQLPTAVEESIAAGIARHTGATPTTRFLEVGVGTGRIALPLVRRGQCCCGVDISAPMLSAARTKAIDTAGRLTLVRSDATALPFGADAFDVGLVVHVFHLLPDWRGALDELVRVIRPGGYFVYGSEQSEDTIGRDEFAARWRTALAPHDLAPRNHRSTDEDVAAALQAHGRAMTTEVVGTWTRSATVRQVLDRYASRDYSSSWSIPEPIFREANATLATWAATRYPDPGTLIENGARFTLLLARLG